LWVREAKCAAPATAARRIVREGKASLLALPGVEIDVTALLFGGA